MRQQRRRRDRAARAARAAHWCALLGSMRARTARLPRSEREFQPCLKYSRWSLWYNIYMMKRGPRPRPAEDRFWEKVDKSAACWIWTGATARFGYGHFRDKGWRSSPTPAHRFSWVLLHGPVPAKLCVLHSCDNPPCVRPQHLFLGTKKTNTHDMIAKGRANLARHNFGVTNGRYIDGRRSRQAKPPV